MKYIKIETYHHYSPENTPKGSKVVSQIMVLFELSMVLPISFKVDPTPHDQLRLVLKIKLLSVGFGDANSHG